MSDKISLYGLKIDKRYLFINLRAIEGNINIKGRDYCASSV